MISVLLFLLAAGGDGAGEGQQRAPASAQPSQRQLPVYTNGTSDPSINEERAHRFIEHRAAELIEQGKCAEARKLALDQRDLDAAAKIAAICAAH